MSSFFDCFPCFSPKPKSPKLPPGRLLVTRATHGWTADSNRTVSTVGSGGGGDYGNRRRRFNDSPTKPQPHGNLRLKKGEKNVKT